MVKRAGGAETVVDGLKNIYTEVATLKLAPDAGQFAQILDRLAQAMLQIIEQITQQKSQQAAQMQAQVRAQAMGGIPGAGGPPGAGGAPPGINPMMGGPAAGAGAGPPRPQPGTPGGPPSQGSPGLVMPNADELRRMLAAQGQGG